MTLVKRGSNSNTLQSKHGGAWAMNKRRCEHTTETGGRQRGCWVVVGYTVATLPSLTPEHSMATSRLRVVAMKDVSVKPWLALKVVISRPARAR